MNKKNILILLVGIFVISLTISQIIQSSRTVITDREVKTYLDDLNNEKLETTKEICYADYCTFKMYKGNYKLGNVEIPLKYCSSFSDIEDQGRVCLGYTNYTDEELELMRKREINKVLSKIYEVDEERKTRIDYTNKPKGEIILSTR